MVQNQIKQQKCQKEEITQNKIQPYQYQNLQQINQDKKMYIYNNQTHIVSNIKQQKNKGIIFHYLCYSKTNKQNQKINQRRTNTNSLAKLTNSNANNTINDNKFDLINKKIKDILDVNPNINNNIHNNINNNIHNNTNNNIHSNTNNNIHSNTNNKSIYKIELTKSNILHNKKTLNTNKQTIKNQSLFIQKTNLTNYNQKQDILDKYNDQKILLQHKQSKQSKQIKQSKQNKLHNGDLYFIQNINRKNHNTTQFYINIHTSILIFKQFLKLSLQSKPKKVDTKIPPQIQNRKTIVFDMDQTLIHTNQTITHGYQLKVPFKVIQGRTSTGYVSVRPYAKQLLIKLSQHFDIIVFTAGNKCYADPILDHIDPNNVIIHRLYRQSCTFVGNQLFVKDLRILGRKLQNIVLVDNAPYSYLMQLANGIPILNYFKGKQDNQLYYLQKYLMKLKNVQDVRQVNKEYFRLHDYLKYDLHEKLIQALYSKSF